MARKIGENDCGHRELICLIIGRWGHGIIIKSFLQTCFSLAFLKSPKMLFFHD